MCPSSFSCYAFSCILNLKQYSIIFSFKITVPINNEEAQNGTRSSSTLNPQNMNNVNEILPVKEKNIECDNSIELAAISGIETNKPDIYENGDGGDKILDQSSNKC